MPAAVLADPDAHLVRFLGQPSAKDFWLAAGCGMTWDPEHPRCYYHPGQRLADAYADCPGCMATALACWGGHGGSLQVCGGCGYEGRIQSWASAFQNLWRRPRVERRECIG
jgi:hypothetical protein